MIYGRVCLFLLSFLEIEYFGYCSCCLALFVNLIAAISATLLTALDEEKNGYVARDQLLYAL